MSLRKNNAIEIEAMVEPSFVTLKTNKALPSSLSLSSPFV